MSLEDFEQTVAEKHLKDISELSREKKHKKTEKNRKLLNESAYLGYDFDEIVNYLFSDIDKHKRPSSADCLIINQNKIYFIEFKFGFKDAIEESKYNIEHIECPSCKQEFTAKISECTNCDIICTNPECGKTCRSTAMMLDLLKKRFYKIREYEKNQLVNSFKIKLLESYRILEKEILPKYAPSIKIEDLQLYFYAVTDDSLELMNDILVDLSGSTSSTKSTIQSIKSALSRFEKIKTDQTAEFLKNYYFDQIHVTNADSIEKELKKIFEQ